MSTEQGGDRDEQLVALIAQQQTRLRAVIRSMMPCPSDCEDILQETNLVLWRKRETYEPGSNFGAWAGTIARFQVMAWRKRHANRPSAGFDGDLLQRVASAAIDHFDDFSERRDALRQCMAGLSTDQRDLIEHRYFKREPLADLAKDRGKTYAAVAKLLERLRTRLRDCVNQRLATERSS